MNLRFTHRSHICLYFDVHFHLFITADQRLVCVYRWFTLTSPGRGVQHEKGTEHLSLLGFDGVQLKQRFQDQSVQLFQPQHLNCKEQQGMKGEKYFQTLSLRPHIHLLSAEPMKIFIVRRTKRQENILYCIVEKNICLFREPCMC